MKPLKENSCILPNKDPPISYIIRIKISLQLSNTLSTKKQIKRILQINYLYLTPPPHPSPVLHDQNSTNYFKILNHCKLNEKCIALAKFDKKYA